jgi:ABC-2 type transport system ATP-binding protein
MREEIHMTYLIRTNRLTKVYGGKEVVSEVSMHVKKGEIYGFLGSNGAGKTTIMKLITNLIKPTNGYIEIFGETLTHKSYEVLKRMGTIIEYPIFHENLTAKEILDLHCEYMGYYDKKEIDQVLDLVNLSHTEGKPVEDFSLGMKQRLGIARAIITKPELLILDEPINGLDPSGIKEIRDLLKMLCKEYGITILISSHILGEMEQIADTIGVIHNGRLISELAMSDVKLSQIDYIEMIVDDGKKAAFILEDKLAIVNYKLVEDHCIRIYESKITQNTISRALMEQNVEIKEISMKKDSLEDYFLKLINGGEMSA